MESVGKNAKGAFLAAQELTAQDKVDALNSLRQALEENRDEIIAANRADVADAEKAVEAGRLTRPTLKRLDLESSADKYASMLEGVRQVALLEEPTGREIQRTELDDDLELVRVTCPIGVILVIFEARPEVIVNIASLAIKSGNAAILKGGKESLKTQEVMNRIVAGALDKTKVPRNFIQMVSSRDEIAQLLTLSQYIDLVIPRGSNDLVRNIQATSQIPVMGHADGLCSIFVDDSADVEKACRIVVDAKTTYASACNAVETLLVHENVLNTKWPSIATALGNAGVSLRCDKATLAGAKSAYGENEAKVTESEDADYSTEFLDTVLAVKAVPSVRDAIDHINAHSSQHTDAIVTEDKANADLFCRTISSAGVYVNASTRFADGFRYGFGTEVGVSTAKTHARGPVGLDGLMIYKYHIRSTNPEGSVTADYGPGKKAYKHER